MADDKKSILKKIHQAAKEGKVEFAESDRLERHQALLEDFMLKVFEMKPGNYFLSDDSSLWDMVCYGPGRESEKERIRIKIFELYGVKILDNPLMVDVLDQVADKLHGYA